MRADSGRQRGVGRPRDAGLRARRALALCAALAALCTALLALVTLPGQGIGAREAHAAAQLPVDSPTSTATSTATGTATSAPSVTPPHLTLISPTSGQGPVGAHLTISGAGWSGGDAVALGTAPNAGACASDTSWAAQLGTAQASGGGTFTTTVTWPTSLDATGTTYSLCAADASGAAATASYRVLSSQPPTLAFSSASATTGKPITLVGSNFTGSGAITLTVTAPGSPHVLGAAQPDDAGSFTFSYIPSSADIGQATVSAASQSAGGAPPTLQAQAGVRVVAAATPTAAARPSPTLAPTVTPRTTGTPTSAGSPLKNPIILLELGLGALLLLGAIVLIVLLLRRDGEPREPRAGVTGPRRQQGPGGYGTWPASDVPDGAPAAGDPFAGSGQFHRSGIFPTVELPARVHRGDVGAWGEPAEGAGTPGGLRPMTGKYRWTPPDEPGAPAVGAAPPDPWAEPPAGMPPAGTPPADLPTRRQPSAPRLPTERPAESDSPPTVRTPQLGRSQPGTPPDGDGAAGG